MPDDLRILAFDTSAAHCAAAVICGDRVLCARVEPMAKGQAERLFPLLEDLLAEAGLTWPDLDALGVGIGPGNFTGVRISVAAARGLSLSLGIPAVGVSATEAAACDATRPCRAVVPLRGDEVVWEDFGAIAGGSATLANAAVTGQVAREDEVITAAASLDSEAVVADQPGLEPASGGVEAASGTSAPSRMPAANPDKSPLVLTLAAEAGHPVLAVQPDAPGVLAAHSHEASVEAGEARLRSPDQSVARPDMPGPKLGRAGELPLGPPVCVPVHPVAVAIARVAASSLAFTGDAERALSHLPRPAPLYLRPADAAPPRDPAPVILR